MYRTAQRIRPTGHRFFSTLKTLKQHEQPFIPTLQQKQFIEWEHLQDCKLVGTSGSGKTLSILQRVKHLVDHKHHNPNDMHILTFSRPTKMDIVNKIHTNNFHQISQENVKTVDSLARYVLKELDQNYKDLSLLSLNFLSLLESDFDAAYPFVKDMKYIFVDEAQDLRHTQIKIIELLREKNESKVCLVGDPCQSIYQFLGCDPSFLVNFPAETFELTKNFRSTQNIVCFGEYFRNKSENKQDAVLSTDEGENELVAPTDSKKKKEVEIYTGSSKQVEKKILKEIANYPGGKANIAILSPMASSRLASNIGLSWVANILTKEKIPFIKQYKDSGLNAWKSQQDIKIDHINLATYTGSKGLEWDFVILLDFSLFKHGNLPTLKEYMEDLNLYYVAITRARKKLLICHKKDTGLFEEVEDQNQIINLNEELQEAEIDVDDIRSQFRNIDKTVQKLSTNQEEEEIETQDDDEASNSRIIENMLHPLVRDIDPEIYQSNITTKAHIQEIEFDLDWLRKDKKIEESMTVTELVSSLDSKAMTGLFENPEFSCEVQTEQIYEKQLINLYGIQNNEALFGIISENLLNQKLGLEGRDYTKKLLNQEYVVCENDQLLNSLKKIFAEGKSPSQVYQMLRQKTLSFNTFNFLKKNFEQNGDFLYKLLIHGSTHRAIMSSLNSIREVNSYKEEAIATLGGENFQESEDQGTVRKNMDFYTVYNSILQYSFASKHNDYIKKAWNGTHRFISDNQTYIDNLQLIADKLLEQNIFWETQVNVNYESILRGSVDLMDANNNIYEVKATRSTTKNHILQSLLYAIMVNKKAMDALEKIQCDSAVINLIKGEIYRYKFSMPHKLLDDFMEENLKRSERLLNRPVYLYEIKAKQFQEQLYIYYLLIRDLKTQNNVLDTFIKYPGYTPPSLEKSSDLILKYRDAPTKLKVEKTLQKLFIKENKPIFLSAPGCDEKGNLLGHLLPADSTIVDGSGFLKLLYPHLREYDYTELYKQAVQFDKSLEELEQQNGKDEIQKALLMSTIVMRNLSLLKDYIQEYSISFYV